MRRIHAFIVVLLIACTLSAQSYRIFAGENYKDYIGNWASPYDSESIWNKYNHTDPNTAANPSGTSTARMEIPIALTLPGTNTPTILLFL